MQTLVGIKLNELLRLLAENKLKIHPVYWPQIALLTLVSLRNSFFNILEERKYRDQLEKVEVRRDPIFILGHWRSGTSMLHNLMALDTRFSFPTIFQIYNPNTFLVSFPMLRKRLEKLKEQKRPMDELRVRYNDPGEEEFAISVMCLRSPVLAWVFPKNENHYDRFLTFKNASPREIADWKHAFLQFIKKLSFNNDRPVLLKSPQNTARIKLLLELFPEARFIHIHRNPYHTFQSTFHLYENTVANFYMQKPSGLNLTRSILDRYNDMYDAFFEQRTLIPEKNYVEICFEEFEQDYMNSIASIYERLNLPDFSEFRPQLLAELTKYQKHRKNKYSASDDVWRKQVARRWAQSFDEWKYPY